MQEKTIQYLMNMPQQPTRIVVSNNKDFAKQCDYCLEIEKGRIKYFGKPDKL